MTDPPARERFRVLLVDTPGHAVPVITRLRKFLKAALRAYGFRCEEIRPERPDQETEEVSTCSE